MRRCSVAKKRPKCHNVSRSTWLRRRRNFSSQFVDARPRIAIDTGIVCPQAPCHRAEAASEQLGTAEAYTRAKASHDNTETCCLEAGFAYQPIGFESVGGMARDAEKVLKSITKKVAINTNTPPGEVARRLWERLSVDLQRAGHRALKRRAGTREMAVGSG